MRNMNNISTFVKYAFATLLGTLCLAGCGQDEKIGLNATDSVAPGLPTNIAVENINGGAIIRYTPPKDDDLLCVVASYMINGVERTTKASPYVDSLIVEGFGKVGDYNIFLRSVDKSLNESELKAVSISPLTPPVEYIYESLKITDSFGGVSLTWKNPTRQNIILEVTKKENGEWVSLENFYSSIVEGQAKIRGLAAEPITLGYRIRDRWDNYSETLELESNPLYEEELNKSKFSEVSPLPGDCKVNGGLPIRNIWQGNFDTDCFHSNESSVGRCITFDMGQLAKISRFKMWQRRNGSANTWTYAHNNLKKYVIYGCTELTDEMYNSGVEKEDGLMYPTFEGWTKIMDVECYKPSGQDNPVVTNEDIEYILNGDEHEVPIDAPSFRYVRILFVESWSNGIHFQIGEMTFWGQPATE